MPFASEVECQLPSTGAHSGEIQLLMETGDTKDDLKLPTFVKIGEHTEEDERTWFAGKWREGQWRRAA